MNSLTPFQQETRQLLHQRLPSILLANMVLMGLLAVSDLVFPTALPALVLPWRLAAITVCGLLLVLHRLDRGQQWGWLIGGGSSLCTGAVILGLMLHTNTVASSAYVALIATITIFTAIAPLTGTHALISGFALVCGYLGAIVSLDFLPAAKLLELAGNLFFLICFVFIAAIQCWADHGAREREFRLRLAESEAARELDRQAGRLEEEVRRRTGEQLLSEQRYRLLYEAITDDLVLVDRDGTVLQANDRYLAHFCGGPCRAGASFYDAVFVADRARVATELLGVLFRGEPVSGLCLSLRTSDGRPLAVEVSGALLERDGSRAAQLLIRDISLRRECEARLLASLDRQRTTESAAILALAKLSEYRDLTPGRHLERIREYCRLLAEQLALRTEFAALLTPAAIQDFQQAALLHDIGKVGIRDAILFKTGPLSGLEEEVLRNHTLTGGDVLKAMEAEARAGSFLGLAKNIAYFHHERWDGTGYPYGLRGEAIPLEARIMHLADAYEGLTVAAAAQAPLGHDQAVARIRGSAGLCFDPAVVEAFLACEAAFDRVRRSLAETA